jgi:small conductance mechanosensitive channel
MIGLTLAGLLAIILVLPISDSSRGQLLSLIGIVLSAAIALSSTTLLGNAMAGLMLRVVRGFRSGDFIRVGDHFGRISEQGLFHVEIQNEDRDLTTLPNLYLVTNPVKVIRSSGTFISASLSLGYDIPHRKIEKLLLDSAVSSGLEDPFVQIIELGDFSITYRVAGLLKEVKQVISTRSRLHAAILDTLHDAGIEIVSPTFMNTRAIPASRVFIPAIESAAIKEEEIQEAGVPEVKVFDKSKEKLKHRFEQAGKELEAAKKQLSEADDDKQRETLQVRIERLEARRDLLEDILKQKSEEQSL